MQSKIIKEKELSLKITRYRSVGTTEVNRGYVGCKSMFRTLLMRVFLNKPFCSRLDSLFFLKAFRKHKVVKILRKGKEPAVSQLYRSSTMNSFYLFNFILLFTFFMMSRLVMLLNRVSTRLIVSLLKWADMSVIVPPKIIQRMRTHTPDALTSTRLNLLSTRSDVGFVITYY